ncbi:MAG TPA: hypothetical protein VLR94_10490, partial [Acidobacteriota bacterium]|nr:hypothetical protein [Acidobacteriota bacterium]
LAVLLISFYYFIRKASAAYGQLQLKWHPPAPFDPRLLRWDLNAAMYRFVFVLLGLVLFLFALYLTRYEYLGDKASVGGQANFHSGKVDFVGIDGKTLSARVNGHQAAAAGIILRFPAWLRYAGLANYQRIVDFRGFNENQYHYNHPPADWLQRYADPLFVFFYKNNQWLGIPKAIYVESPYFSPGKHQIFVTHSGYIVE